MTGTNDSIRRLAEEERLCGATVANGLVFLAGQVADDASLDAEGQTADILAQIDETLREAGTDKTRILKANIYLADIATIGEMNSVWDQWVVPDQTPARATVEAKLANPGWAVEIMIEAAI